MTHRRSSPLQANSGRVPVMVATARPRALCWAPVLAAALLASAALRPVQAAESDPAPADAAVAVTNADPTPSGPEAEPPADADPAPRPPIEIRRYLVLPKVGDYKRSVVTRDPIDRAIAAGEWRRPRAGDKVTAADGEEHAWRAVSTVDAALTVNECRGGYAFATVNSDADAVMILDAQRHAAARVNDAWFPGDPYGAGRVRIPVALKAGENHLLFHVAQPGFQARLTPPTAPAYFLPDDATTPSVVAGQERELWVGVPVANATNKPLAGAEVVVSVDGGRPTTLILPTLPPLFVYKAPIRVPAPGAVEADHHRVRLELTTAADGAALAEPIELQLPRVQPADARVCTFVSRIDGGVQAYSVLPAAPGPDAEGRPGVVLALHGAGDDHRGFIDNFLAKPWAHVVAPSNRGRYGFDWEDWGAIDAMEALADAQRRLDADRTRVYCTGHSMGGHGAWRLGVTHPDRFAAVGPSAGWLSLWSYGGRMPAYEEPTPVEQMLLRSASSSDTLKLIDNLSQLGVYVLHGDRDALVGVSQSRFMRSRLGEFHPDFAYHEHRGAGNWWGSECCDWPAMMRFFRDRRVPEPHQVRQLSFTTTDLGLTAECHWARIETQQHQGRGSSVDLRMLKNARAFSGATDNVARLSLDPAPLGGDGPLRIKLDGGRAFSVRHTPGQRIWLSRDDRGRWSQIARPPVGGKSPRRHGMFKSAFDNNALLVYSTGGTPEENAWSLAKARYDAQTFWTRGAGALEVVADSEFNADRQRNRNVVLYGNADTNLAWPSLLSTSPVQVRGGRVTISSHGLDRPEDDPGLAVLFVRPRPRSNAATVGVVSGVDLAGMRLTDRIRYFHSGVGIPDFVLLGGETPSQGEYGVRAAGYFGHDWTVDTGDIAWRDTAL